MGKNMMSCKNEGARSQRKYHDLPFVSLNWSNEPHGIRWPQQSLLIIQHTVQEPLHRNKTESQISYRTSVYFINLKASDTFYVQIIVFRPQTGQLKGRDIHKMTKISGEQQQTSPAEVLISARGIRPSETWMHQSPNGLMLISTSANYRKKKLGGGGVWTLFLGGIRSQLMIDVFM